ncbi:MAG: hypothetical protein JW829_11375 [Pirellulales bacterium]|nr:hypothetical protein [Pirellulales bacterium]
MLSGLGAGPYAPTFIGVNVSGGDASISENPMVIAGGNAGNAIIHSGVNVDIGTAEGLNGEIDLFSSSGPIHLGGPGQPTEYTFRQFRVDDILAPEIVPEIIVHGDVTIRTQYIVIGTITRAPGIPAPTVRLFAGQPVIIGDGSGYVDSYEAWHCLTVDLTPSPGDLDLDGGNFKFYTTANTTGLYLDNLWSEGGDGRNGGDGGNGGNIEIVVHEGNLTIGLGGINTSGGYGGNAWLEDGTKSAGGHGGDAGDVLIFAQKPELSQLGGQNAQAVAEVNMPIRANGGDGGLGDSGTDGDTGQSGGDGYAGGDGGQGGGITIRADIIQGSGDVEAFGGAGGNGGFGGEGGDSSEGPGGNGGKGGSGGAGGGRGNLLIDAAGSLSSVIDYGDGGGGGIGGDGGSGNPAGNPGEPGEDGHKGGDTATLPTLSNPPPSDTWTVMVYGAADDLNPGSLEQTIVGIINNLEQSNLTSSQINLAVLLDRVPGISNARIPSDDWTSTWSNFENTRIGFITFDADLGTQDLAHFETVLTPIYRPPLVPPDELSTGDPSTLEYLIEWATTRAPAKNYAVVLLDHGGVWTGVMFDNSQNDYLSMSELQRALSSGPPIDILVFHACLMQATAVAAQVAGYVDYMVGSEDTVPHLADNSMTRFEQICGYFGIDTNDRVEVTTKDAFQLKEWMNWLVANPTSTPQLAAKQLVELAAKSTDSISSLDLLGGGTKMADLLTSLDDFASYFISGSPTATQWSQLDTARSAANFITSVPWLVDLGAFMQGIVASFESHNDAFSKGVKQLAQAVDTQLKQLIDVKEGRSGLSITAPVTGQPVHDGFPTAATEFVHKAPHWLQLLVAASQQTATGAVHTRAYTPQSDVGGEPATALNLDVDSGQQAIVVSLLENAGDADAYRFVAASGEEMIIDFFGEPGDESSPNPLTLTVKTPDGQELTFPVPTGMDDIDRGQLTISGALLSSTGTHILTVSGANVGEAEYSFSLIHGSPSQLAPQVLLNHSTVDFGSVTTGEVAEASLTISNTGGTPLTIEDLVLPDGSPFVTAGASQLPLFTVEPYGSVELPLGCYSEQLGPVSDSFVIHTNDPVNPAVSVNLLATIDGPDPLSADFNGDGQVDGEDLDLWEVGFATATGAGRSDGDADGDGDVDGNDFLAWQLNFGSTSSSGSAANSSTGSGTTDNGSDNHLNTADPLADSSNDTKDDSFSLIRSKDGNGQGTSILQTARRNSSFESVDFAGWSLPQPLSMTISNTTAWLDLPQFQPRDASRPFQRDRAVDDVMSGMDDNGSRTYLERVPGKVQGITIMDITTGNDEMWMVSRIGKTSLPAITGRSTQFEDRVNLEMVLEELTIEPVLRACEVFCVSTAGHVICGLVQASCLHT